MHIFPSKYWLFAGIHYKMRSVSLERGLEETIAFKA